MKWRSRRDRQEPEGWPDPVVDESLLGGGPHELSHQERQLEAERQAAAERAKRLRDDQEQGFRAARPQRTRPRHRNRVRNICIALSIGFLSAAAYFVNHPLHSSSRAASNASASAGASPTSAPASGDATTSTTIWFPWQYYSVGTCVTWDQTPGEGSERNSSAVPCSKPHLVEIVQPSQEISGLGPQFPTESELETYIQAHCATPAEKFLGQPVDPHGRFTVNALATTELGWDEGFREMSCDIQLVSLTSGDALTPWTGDVRGADQTLLLPVGTCQSETVLEVPCTAAHTAEITGSVQLPATVTAFPTTESQWQQLVGQSCDKLALSYAGGTLPPGVSSGWQEITAAGWSVGNRTVQCIIGRLAADNTTWTSYTGSLQGTGTR